MAEAQRRLKDDSDEGGAKSATERALHELIPTVRTLLGAEPDQIGGALGEALGGGMGEGSMGSVPHALLRLAE